ncbi:MAG: tetratricopeptide repeat protein [Nitrospiria bacterium]
MIGLRLFCAPGAVCIGFLLATAGHTPAAGPSVPDSGQVLWEAQDAYDRGDASRSAASAETFLGRFPGHPRSADVQFLLAQAREQTGEWRAALEQYRLFVDNYPQHLKRDEASARAARLARRQFVGPTHHPITRWMIVDEITASVPMPGPDVGVIVVQRPDRDGSGLEREANRFTAAGRRVWIGMMANRPPASFDLFDDANVERVEAQILAMVSWPIDGIVIGPGLYLAAEAPLGPAAEQALATLTMAGSADRRAWAWSGMRARRSAAVLDRWVHAAATRPDLGWMIAVAPEAIVDPVAGVYAGGQDLVEVVRAAPRAIVAVVDPEGVAPDSWRSSLARVGVTNRIVAWWGGRGEIVAWP